MRTTSEELSIRQLNRNELTEIRKELVVQGTVLGGTVTTLWALELVDIFLLGQGLNAWGLVPGKITGLIGLLTAPFLHGGLLHLIGNTVPFLLFSWLIMLRDNREWAAVTAISAFTSGMGTWLLGWIGLAPAIPHVGASGVIFGYFGYLLTVGLFERKFGAVLLSLFVGLSWGSLVFGMIPGFVPPFVSWQMHLFGFLGGALTAWLINSRSGQKKARKLLTS
ncbi:MAG: rhomboid family intramembrane serine protease [Myxococcota bacterium]